MNFDLKEFINNGPRDFVSPTHFSFKFEGDGIDPKDSEYLSFCAYRAVIKNKITTGQIQAEVWFYLDESGKVGECFRRILAVDEVSARLTTFSKEGHETDSQTLELLELIELESEFDWGAVDKVAFVKATFIC